VTTMQIVAAVASVLIVAWPWLKYIAAELGITIAGFLPATPRPAKASVSYEEAIHNLAVVRSRLVATSHLSDEQKKAIDTLTLALVAGSDT
jgi:hypothetical protein